MNIKVNKDILKKQYKVISRLLGSDKNGQLTFFVEENKLYMGAIKELYELNLYLADTTLENVNATINYHKLGSILDHLDDVFAVDFSNEASLTFKDKFVNIKLEKLVAEVLPSVNMSIMTNVVDNGMKIDLNKFKTMLGQLQKLTTVSTDDLMGDIYLANGYSFVVDTVHLIRYKYLFPYQMVLDKYTSKVLLELITSNSDQEEFYILENGTNRGDFYISVNNCLLTLRQLSTYIKDTSKVVNSFQEEDDEVVELNINKEQFIKYLTLALKFIEAEDEQDLTFTVKNGKGLLNSNTGNNNAKGLVTVEGGNVKLSLNAVHLNKLLKNISSNLNDVFKMIVNIDTDTALIEHNNGDIYLSVAVEE